MPTVSLAFSAIPGHVRTARLVAATVARRAGVDDALLDEVRLAVGEACSRAVGLHREHAPEVAVEVSLSDGDRFTIIVRDRGPAGAEVAGSGHVEAVELVDPSEMGAPSHAQAGDAGPEHLPGGFGLAVIAGLVDDLEVEAPEDGPGTAVCMSWPTGPASGAGEPTG